ncbi:hypothetical protein LZP73_00915 [Shewanella sp. AS16]|uniref:hypothetical protein n=1 Tax=Shewanella sp. AS16 TaxID=2907625 RepID=UPI001F323768|nr:hypothetical protein [Shewanella sp. AS16]MCE9684774.1 hypothetical protein [Shewanella sp. AS16]
MVSFTYNLNSDLVEVQASDWNGLERVFINGSLVSRKLNFGPRSEHLIKYKDGHSYRFQLLLDPQTQELTCRIYRRELLVTSLKQGKEHLLRTQRYLQHSLSFACVAILYLMWLNV